MQLTLYYGTCSHARASREAVQDAIKTLEQEGIRLEYVERVARDTHCFLNGEPLVEISLQACDEAREGRCAGFLYQGEFYAALNEAVVKDAVHASLGIRPRRVRATGCCGSGCPDCPYS